MSAAAQSGVEPPSGMQGEGTVDKPFDQGNAPEQAAGPGVEPPSGQQGAGTIDEPYDQGNQPEQPKSEPQASSTSNRAVAGPSPDDPLASSSTTHQGSGDPLSVPTEEQAQVIHESRGRDEAVQQAPATGATGQPKSTGTAAKGGDFDASKPGAGKEASRLRYEERDVSPGEMKDGSHVKTSGDRGESYTPSKINKLKDKFHFGKH